jgi:outer membrane protein OmpA-like peptidoglycan-associated protein
MLSKIFGCSALAGAALMVGSLPALAHEGHDNMCGGVNEKDADMIMTSSGKPLLLGTSAPCPAVEQVAAVETETVEVTESTGATRSIAGDGAGAAGLLPNDGMVYFPLDSDQLEAEDQALLNEIVAALAAQNPSSVTIMGHADRSGGDDYNMDLSERRARTVASALMDAGIPASAINTMGYGETEPAVATEDGVAMRQNRRAILSPQ